MVSAISCKVDRQFFTKLFTMGVIIILLLFMDKEKETQLINLIVPLISLSNTFPLRGALG